MSKNSQTSIFHRAKYSLMSTTKPHQFFVVTGVFFGLAMIFITPPFQVPDEINHWYRAYQISTGQLLAEMQDNRLGGHLPNGVIEITQPFLALRWNMNAKDKIPNCRGPVSHRFTGRSTGVHRLPEHSVIQSGLLFSPVNWNFIGQNPGLQSYNYFLYSKSIDARHLDLGNRLVDQNNSYV